MPQGCEHIILACTAQPRGYTGMGKVFRSARVGWWDIVQVGMLHRQRDINSEKYFQHSSTCLDVLTSFS